MIAISTKPVRECSGCALNLVKTCAIFEHPILKWKHRKCEGYNNADLIALYERKQNPEGKKQRAEARAERAKLAHTAPHHDGTHRLGGVR